MGSWQRPFDWQTQFKGQHMAEPAQGMSTGEVEPSG